jgi:rod shape-determining protein MreD
MTEFSDQILIQGSRKRRTSRYSPLVLVAISLAAILFQVYVPLFFQYLSYLELPLLVTVYFSLMRRQPVAGIAIGCLIGLLQDSLSHQPIGMFGIVKTLIGYFAASVSVRFDVDNPLVRALLGFIFFCFHQTFYWLLTSALLGQNAAFDAPQTLLFGVLNAVVALPLFHFLDKMRGTA